jgi:hypothetical protein
VGAANLLTMHQETKLEDTCARGGWYMESMSKAFSYIAGILESVSRAGTALSGSERGENEHENT